MANNPTIPMLAPGGTTDDYRAQTGVLVGDEVHPGAVLFAFDENLLQEREVTFDDLAWPVAEAPLTPLTLAVTTSAAQISTGLAVKGVAFLADPDNTVNILCGDVTTQSWPLAPGSSLAVNVQNLSGFWFKTASGTATLHAFPVA